MLPRLAGSNSPKSTPCWSLVSLIKSTFILLPTTLAFKSILASYSRLMRRFVPHYFLLLSDLPCLYSLSIPRMMTSWRLKQTSLPTMCLRWRLLPLILLLLVVRPHPLKLPRTRMWRWLLRPLSLYVYLYFHYSFASLNSALRRPRWFTLLRLLVHRVFTRPW
jgi:hypothetical protein